MCNKFNKLVVKAKLKAVVANPDDPDEYAFADEEVYEIDEVKKPKTNIILGIVALGGILMIMTSGDDTGNGKKKKKSKYSVQEVTGSAAISMKGKKKKDKSAQKKMNNYFQKGLREFREKNFFRALSEFEHALAWQHREGNNLFWQL